MRFNKDKWESRAPWKDRGQGLTGWGAALQKRIWGTWYTAI